MAAYCEKCGAKLNEDDEFCGMCGAPVGKGATAKGGATAKEGRTAKEGSGNGAKNYKTIGIAAVAVVALIAVVFVVKGIGGAPKDDGERMDADGMLEEEDDVLAHLRPWMGDWMCNHVVNTDQVCGLPSWYMDDEGFYNGHILSLENSKGRVHVDEQYIDFSEVTKDQKDCFPVSELTYYETEYGADAFESEDRELRILFYKHYKPGETDYGEIIRIQAYVGMVEPETYYIGETPFAKGPSGGSDGWAVDNYIAFVRWDG